MEKFLLVFSPFIAGAIVVIIAWVSTRARRNNCRHHTVAFTNCVSPSMPGTAPHIFMMSGSDENARGRCSHCGEEILYRENGNPDGKRV